MMKTMGMYKTLLMKAEAVYADFARELETNEIAS